MNVEAMLGFIGLGHMGLPMASRLLAAGHKVLAFDLRQDACLALAAQGAEIAASPRAVADRAITVFLSLPGSVLDEEAEIDLMASTRVRNEVAPVGQSMEALVEHLIRSKRPVILAGRELADLRGEVADLSLRL
ncbi:MAG: hypothetical protein EBX54_12090, partial [Betaproteobacteria bacterium]|nr:hypothetical protein [Betaproteobacteria bacterium]